jgi:hypothetical protein
MIYSVEGLFKNKDSRLVIQMTASLTGKDKI